MSNTNSALVRSNLGNSGALTLAAGFAPRAINALVRKAANAAVQQLTNPSSRGGGQIPLPQQKPQRAPRRRNRKGRGNDSQAQRISSSPGSSSLPSVRRVVRGSYELMSNVNGKVQPTFTVGFINVNGVAILSDMVIGIRNFNFLASYTHVKIHRVTVTIYPGTSANESLTYGIGYSPKSNFPLPGSMSDLSDLAVLKMGYFTEKGSITFQPHNVHGNVVPTSTNSGDDKAEQSCGSIAGWINSSAVSKTVAIVGFEIDITCLDA